MNYEKVRALFENGKNGNSIKRMKTHDYGRFTILLSDKAPGILIDTELAEKAAQWRWCIDSSGYAVCNTGSKLVRMHDFVMAHVHDEKPAGCFIDHINRDKLDNRLQNLRFVTPEENSLNVGMKANNTSGYTGVSKTKHGTYRAYITVKKQRIELGHFKTIEEAIAVRREAEVRLGFLTRSGTIKDRLSIMFDDPEVDDGR